MLVLAFFGLAAFDGEHVLLGGDRNVRRREAGQR
jgi:hypothetical protein